MRQSFWQFALHYGLRSLWRNPRRTVLTIATVLVSVAVTIVGVRFSRAIMSLWQTGASDTGLGHAQVHAAGYWQKVDDVSASMMIDETNEVHQRLSDDQHVDGFSRRLKLEGIISAGERTLYFVGAGVAPSDEWKVSPRLFNPSADEGSFVDDEDTRKITVGRGLAEALRLKVGDEVSLISPTISGSVNAVDVVIGGIVNVPLPSFSKRAVYMHISQARKLIRVEGMHNEIAIRLRNPLLAPQWVEDHRNEFSSLGVDMRGWWEIDPVIRDVEDIFYGAIGIVSFLLFISAGLSVLNMIFMLVAERTIEIGTLMAIGAEPKDVRTLFGLEAALIGVAGGVLGAIVGNAAVGVMNVVGVPFKNPFGSGTIDVHPTMDAGLSITIIFAGVLLCILASVPPSRKASKVEPVQAFRGQLS
jgi:putative ABC transport system permease protein